MFPPIDQITAGQQVLRQWVALVGELDVDSASGREMLGRAAIAVCDDLDRARTSLSTSLRRCHAAGVTFPEAGEVLLRLHQLRSHAEELLRACFGDAAPSARPAFDRFTAALSRWQRADTVLRSAAEGLSAAPAARWRHVEHALVIRRKSLPRWRQPSF